MNKVTQIKPAFLFGLVAAVPLACAVSQTYNHKQILKELQLKDKSADEKFRNITRELEEQRIKLNDLERELQKQSKEQRIKLNDLERELQKQSKEKNQTQQETPNKNPEIDIRNGKDMNNKSSNTSYRKRMCLKSDNRFHYCDNPRYRS